jgi:phospholipase/carboxylesterase
MLSRWLDALPGEFDLTYERLVLGGFSQGAVMSYALALGAGRPPPASLVALSGFIPTVEGFELDLAARQGFPVAIGHGTLDQVIPARFGRDAANHLQAAGLDVLYHESPIPHTIDPAFIGVLRRFIDASITSGSGSAPSGSPSAPPHS